MLDMVSEQNPASHNPGTTYWDPSLITAEGRRIGGYSQIATQGFVGENTDKELHQYEVAKSLSQPVPGSMYLEKCHKTESADLWRGPEMGIFILHVLDSHKEPQQPYANC